MTPDEPNLADLLLRKADQDLYVLDKLVADARAPVEVFGFHAQQATEKILKAWLAAHRIPYGRTHRLGELLDLANDHNIPLPEPAEVLADLTPYAVEFRYDVVPEDTEDPLDKAAMLSAIRSLRSWVQTNLPQSK